MPVMNKTCIIDGQNIHSMAELYRELARQLPFPAHFGNNLDALWDVLTTDIEGPIQIIWNGAEASRRAMGKDFDQAVGLLLQVGKERKDFHVTITQVIA